MDTPNTKMLTDCKRKLFHQDSDEDEPKAKKPRTSTPKVKNPPPPGRPLPGIPEEESPMLMSDIMSDDMELIDISSDESTMHSLLEEAKKGLQSALKCVEAAMKHK